MNTTYLNQLLDHLLTCSDRASLEEALNSLLTPSELSDISKRLQILRMLEEGIPQREIAQRLGVGIATVTRGSHALKTNKATD